jgi:hypothetical protein
MGDATMKPRFFIIVAVVALIVIIGIAAASNSASNAAKKAATPTPAPIIATPAPPAIVTYTVGAAIGVQSITVTNQNRGSTLTLTAADLPKSLNCPNGDTLTFKVIATSGYRFNAWMFGDQQFDSHNPYTIKALVPFTIEARFLMNPEGTG